MSEARVIPLGGENQEAALRATRAALDRGELVCLPTETVYGVGGRADRPEARARLAAFKGGRDAPYTVHVATPDDVETLGVVPPQARRLMRAYMPGPLTLVLDATGAASSFATAGTIGLRVVAHDFTRAVCSAPTLLTSANVAGARAATTFDAALATAGDHVTVAIDAGPCRIGEASTVVRVTRDGSLQVLREAALAERRILARAATLVLFVCSGNTCRSPMAEVLARQRWSEQLGVAPGALVSRGLIVASAGVHAFPGLPASDHAVAALAELGLDLSHHASQPLEPALAARAGRIYCMGTQHVFAATQTVAAAGGAFDDTAHAPELLGRDREVEDPFGASIDVYRRARDLIAALLPPVRELD